VGYKVGWILSGIVIVGVCGVLVKMLMFPSEPEPSGEVKFEDLKFKKPSVEISEILGSTPSGGGNAADNYVKAMEVYANNRDQINAMVTDFDTGDKRSLSTEELNLCEKIRSHVRAGAMKKEMNYILEHTPKTLKPSVPGYIELIGVRDALLSCLFRHNYNVKDFENCKVIAGEVMTMGWHLMSERSRGLIVMAGAQIQLDSAQFLSLVHAEQEKHDLANLCSRYQDEMRGLYANFNKKMEVLRSANPDAGDVFLIIRRDEDRTWRVEGIYSLLFLRYRKRKSRGTVRAIDSLLNSYRGDSDPLVAAAVESVLGNDVPEDQFLDWWMKN